MLRLSRHASARGGASAAARLLVSASEAKTLDAEGVEVYNRQRYAAVKRVPTQQRLACMKRLMGLPHYTVSAHFISSDEIAELNRLHRGIANPTDVLSFPHVASFRPGLLGDVDAEAALLGTPARPLPSAADLQPGLSEGAARAASEAEASQRHLGDMFICPLHVAVHQGYSGSAALNDRVLDLMAHSMAHLVGYTHDGDDDYEAMERVEQRLLRDHTTLLQVPPHVRMLRVASE